MMDEGGHKKTESESKPTIKQGLSPCPAFGGAKGTDPNKFKSGFKFWIRIVAFIVVAVFLPEQAARAEGDLGPYNDGWQNYNYDPDYYEVGNYGDNISVPDVPTPDVSFDIPTLPDTFFNNVNYGASAVPYSPGVAPLTVPADLSTPAVHPEPFFSNVNSGAPAPNYTLGVSPITYTGIDMPTLPNASFNNANYSVSMVPQGTLATFDTPSLPTPTPATSTYTTMPLNYEYSANPELAMLPNLPDTLRLNNDGTKAYMRGSEVMHTEYWREDGSRLVSFPTGASAYNNNGYSINSDGLLTHDIVDPSGHLQNERARQALQGWFNLMETRLPGYQDVLKGIEFSRYLTAQGEFSATDPDRETIIIGQRLDVEAIWRAYSNRGGAEPITTLTHEFGHLIFRKLPEDVRAEYRRFFPEDNNVLYNSRYGEVFAEDLMSLIHYGEPVRQFSLVEGGRVYDISDTAEQRKDFLQRHVFER